MKRNRITLAATQLPSGDRVSGGLENNARRARGALSKIGRNAKCSTCPNSLTITDNKNGNQICNSCGLILESSIISQEQEWRNFSSDEGSTDRSRVGGPNDVWMKDTTGSTSMIGALGNYKRMAVLQDMSTQASGTDRQIRTAFMNLKSLQEYFNLKEATMEHAREMIKDMERMGCLKNRTGNVHMLAVVYMVLREENIIKPLKDFTGYDATIQEKDLGKTINRLKKLLAVRKHTVSTGASVSELIPRFGTALGLSRQISVLATNICSKAEKLNGVKMKSNPLAAACLLWTLTLCGIEGINPADVAMAARSGLTQVMLALKEITQHHALIVTPDIEKYIQTVKSDGLS